MSIEAAPPISVQSYNAGIAPLRVAIREIPGAWPICMVSRTSEILNILRDIGAVHWIVKHLCGSSGCECSAGTGDDADGRSSTILGEAAANR